jgi:hypothetical protein
MNRLLFTLLAALPTPFEPWNFKLRPLMWPLRSSRVSNVRAAQRLAQKKRNQKRARRHA